MNILKFGKIIYEWLSQFAPTYRGVLPSGQQPQGLYLQISGYYDNFATQFIYPVQIYAQKTTSYESVVKLADKIENAVGEGGILLSGEGVKVKIEKGSPFYQDKPDEDETIRAGYINLIIKIF